MSNRLVQCCTGCAGSVATMLLWTIYQLVHNGGFLQKRIIAPCLQRCVSSLVRKKGLNWVIQIAIIEMNCALTLNVLLLKKPIGPGTPLFSMLPTDHLSILCPAHSLGHCFTHKDWWAREEKSLMRSDAMLHLEWTEAIITLAWIRHRTQARDNKRSQSGTHEAARPELIYARDGRH